MWAPGGPGVRVTGDFDGWAGWTHPMRSLGSSGVWEIFVPGVGVGNRYKFRILGPDGVWREKSDPMAFATEVPPSTASVVTALHHEWGDEEWLEQRARSSPRKEPMSVYEVHLGSWRRGLSYREAAHQLVDYLAETGFTHVELLPVAEHPFGGSWGYQVTSFYAPTARFGTPDDFRYFVDTLHQAGYGIIVDWVPGRFPKDDFALARFDGTPLYEHADPRRGEQPDWGTYVFDFGRRRGAQLPRRERAVLAGRVPRGRAARRRGGIDALPGLLATGRAVAAQHLRRPGEPRRRLVPAGDERDGLPPPPGRHDDRGGVDRVARRHPPTHLGGLGFGFKWNMGWMHDTLSYIGKDPIYRGYHHSQMTFSLVYAFSENYVLPLSHDEVVHGKGSLWERMPGDAWNKAAGLRALLAFMWAHPGKQLLFMGGEFGQAREWSEDRSLDWELLANPLHGGVKNLVADLNRVYKDHSALWTRDNTPEGFSWIDANDASGNVLSFLRHGVDADGNPTVLACIANFSGGPSEDYRVGLPFTGRWREVLNTDAELYGGSGVGNLGAVEAEPQMWHGRPASAALRLPPSGVLWLAPERGVVDEVGPEQAADIGQAAPVAPSAPDVVGDTTPATPPTAAAGNGATEFFSGDGTSTDDALPEGADGAPHRPHPAPPEDAVVDSAVVDSAPSASVSDDAPIVSPAVPAIEVPPPGTGAEEAPVGTAYADPPVLEPTPGAPLASADEPRFASDAGEEAVTIGGEPDALSRATPSATRPAADSDGDPSADDSNTHQ